MVWSVRLISHTKNMLKTNRHNERLCNIILQTLKEMLSVDETFGAKVSVTVMQYLNVQ